MRKGKGEVLFHNTIVDELKGKGDACVFIIAT
jgi:hypothetical protein